MDDIQRKDILKIEILNRIINLIENKKRSIYYNI